jgi:hypothetical protein
MDGGLDEGKGIPMKRLACLVLVVCACADTQEPDDGDHAIDRVVLEDQQIVDLFGAGGTTDPVRTSEGFRRLGFLWDATEDGAFELRTSVDGIVWSSWRVPEVVSVEEQARAGHADAIQNVGPEGSIAGDPRAFFYQLRAPAGVALPTFMVIEPLADIPPFVVEELDVPDPDRGVAFFDVRSTPIGSVRIYSRADWGARAPRCASGSTTPTRATIHHTVTPTNDSMTPQARLRQIQSFHMNSRGWCDIGYNYLISRDGRVWRARGAQTLGAHVSNANSGNVGISFIGTYTSTAPTATQMCQSAKLLRRLRMDFPGIALDRTDVKGHRQYGGTVCPGNALYNRIDAILRKARGGCNVN